MNILIFGAGINGRLYYNINNAMVKDTVCYFVDNNHTKIGLHIDNIPVISPKDITQGITWMEGGQEFFDKIVVAVPSEKAFAKISEQLISYGLNAAKIENFTSTYIYKKFESLWNYFPHCFISIDEKYSFYYDENVSDYLIANIGFNDVELKLIIRNRLDLAILSEKFIFQDYNYFLPHNTVVFDIGMNNGFSSLYFASRENVKSVHSFELFRPTFDTAVHNFNLNSELAEKIQPYPFGLGSQNDNVSCIYSESHDTACGFYDVRRFDPGLEDTVILDCEVRKASEIINDIYLKELFMDDSIRIVLKIDVEGAEYDILNDLDSETPSFFNYVDIIMMEYHMGKEAITETLSKYGFLGFSFHHGSFGEGNDRGMLYFIKNKPRRIAYEQNSSYSPNEIAQ